VGEVLEVENRAETLIASVSADLDAAIQRSQDRPDAARKRVLFILSTKDGRILASGLNTAANGILEMAGARNAVTEFEGYKPLTDEAVSAVAPDVILMMARGDNHSAANDALFAMPAIATTPAAQTRSVVRMNGLYLLGFGPRTAAAITDLSTALYGP
jgi:iron complex transport system substrate-binding protein